MIQPQRNYLKSALDASRALTETESKKYHTFGAFVATDVGLMGWMGWMGWMGLMDLMDLMDWSSLAW